MPTDDPTSRTAEALDYSILPPGSSVTCEVEGEELLILFSPSPRSRFVFPAIFAAIFLLALTAAIAFLVWVSDLNLLIKALISMGTLGTLWGFLVARIVKRSRTPTSIVVSPASLRLVTPDEWILCRELPIKKIREIKAVRRGTAVSGRITGELLFKSSTFRWVGALRGHAYHELEWIAARLRNHIQSAPSLNKP